jgi:two-component system, NarL family, response regulator LiaR
MSLRKKKMTKIDKIKVLLVDDHTVVRSGLSAVLSISDDLELVGEASDGAEAVKAVERLQPDVVLMDLLMPNMDGVEATRIIKERWPKVQVIALTSFKEKEYVEGALKAGATGYLLKNVTADELVNSVRRSVQGQPTLSPEAAQVLIHNVNEPQKPGFTLTDREREILKLMIEGLSNNQIAARLVLSQSTAKFHVSNILSKLGAATRTEAVALAMKQHLV